MCRMVAAAACLGQLVVSLGAATKKMGLWRRGLRRRVIQVPESSTTIVCWVPKNYNSKETTTKTKQKPALVLLHGFGSNGTDAWAAHVAALSTHFALFIPDLLFFGDSSTCSTHRSELFQAHCLHHALLSLGLSQAFVAGHSYGGFVAYRLAHLYPSFVSKLIIIASGLMMDCHSNDSALQKTGAASIHDILAPPSLPAFKQTLQLVFNKQPKIPDFILLALLKNPNRTQHLELIDAIELGQDDVSSQLPKILQKTLILWGDEDQIFNVQLAHELQGYLDGVAQLKIFNGIGHVPQLAPGFDEEIISFLTKET